MATPDVRVRLSAEGQAEVIAALRSIQAESAKAGSGGARGFLQLNGTLSSLTRLAGLAAAAVGAIGLANLGRNAITAAEDMQNLRSRLGGTVKDLSAIDVALRTMGSSLKDQQRALTSFFENTQDAATLGGEAFDKFARMKMDPKQIEAFAGQDIAQRLQAVAAAYAKMPDGPERTAAAIGVLGVRGAALIPLLEKISKVGLSGLVDDAEQLSALLDEQTLAAVGALNDAFDNLAITSQGLATEFMAGFAEPMVAAIHAVTGELKTSQQFWRDFGTFAGEAIGKTTVAVTVLADVINTKLQTEVTNMVSLFRAAGDALTGNFEQAGVRLEAVGLRRDAAEEALRNRITVAWRRFDDRQAESARKRIGETEDTELSSYDRLAKAKADIRKAQADADIRIAQEVAKARDDADKGSFDRGLLTVTQYYESRRKTAVEAINAEIAALIRQRIESERGTDPKKGAETAKINGEIRRLQIERGSTEARLADERDQALQKLATAQLGFEKDLLEAQGKRHAAAMVGIEAEIAKRAEEFKNLPTDQREGMLANLRATLELQERFNVAQDEATRAMADFGRARDEISRRVDAGLMSEVEGDAAIAELESARIARLRELGDELMRVAEISGDPERIARAQEFLGAVAEIEVAVEHARSTLLRLRAAFGDALRSGLEDFFATGVRESKNLGDAISRMALSILGDLNRIISRLLATKIAMSLLRLIPGGAGAAPAGIPGQVSDVFTGHEGGEVPGTGTGDKVSALLEPQEFVVKRARVALPGVREGLERLNAGLVSAAPVGPHSGPLRFSEGGLVPAGDRSSGPTSVMLGLEDGLVVRAMDSPAGHRVIVRANAKNRKTIGKVLGGRG